MEKIKIRNYGPIKNATLDIKSFVVLIGPQSSGKSAIAKLISILRDLIYKRSPNAFINMHSNFDIEDYLIDKTFVEYTSKKFKFTYKSGIGSFTFKKGYNIDEYRDKYDRKKIEDYAQIRKDKQEQLTSLINSTKNMLDLENHTGHNSESIVEKLNSMKILSEEIKVVEEAINEMLDFGEKFINFSKSSIYIPSERNIYSILSKSSFSIMFNDIPLPSTIKNFGALLENAQNNIEEFAIPFLNMIYKFENNKVSIIQNKIDFSLPNMSSGIQALIPLLLVLEVNSKDKWNKTFVIEEPEMNLFPEAQYELLKLLVNKCFENKNASNDVIITTHSPYILSGINNLVMAGISGATTAHVNNIIDRGSWLNHKDYNAYYVDHGTVRGLIDPSSGLIDNNELDSTSYTINNDFNEMFDIIASSR